MWRKYDSAEEAEYISKAGRYIMKKGKVNFIKIYENRSSDSHDYHYVL